MLTIAIVVAVHKRIKYRGWDNTSESIGEAGEAIIAQLLNDVAEQFGGYVLNDVYLPSGNQSTQIDHIYISEKGIFIIETKNYVGRIYGNESSKYWTQVLSYGSVKNKMYNPLKQNETHLNAVRRILGVEYTFIPLVVFVHGNTRYIDSFKVYSPRELKKIIVAHKVVHTKIQVERAYSKLCLKQIHSEEEKQRHARYVNGKKNY